MNNDQFAIMVLAKRRAKLAVKANLKARGARLSYVSARDIAELARDYLAQHRAELVALASKEWEAINDRTGIGVATRATLPQPRA